MNKGAHTPGSAMTLGRKRTSLTPAAQSLANKLAKGNDGGGVFGGATSELRQSYSAASGMRQSREASAAGRSGITTPSPTPMLMRSRNHSSSSAASSTSHSNNSRGSKKKKSSVTEGLLID